MSRSPTELDALLASLSGAVTTFQDSLHSQDLPPLRSNDPAPHPIDLGLADPVTWYSRKAIVGLCHEIIALVQSPPERASVDGLSYLVSAAMTVVCDGSPSAVDIVEASGDTGVLITDIASKTGKDNIKLRTIFRLLTTTGYFKELAFGRISRTRSTFALRPGQNFISCITHLISGGMAAASILPESTQSAPVMGIPGVFETFHKVPLFKWLVSHPRYVSRFQQGLTVMERHHDPGLLSDYSWDELGPAVTLVDVGSGHGGLCMELLRRFKAWKAVLQDLPGVVVGAKEFWTRKAPEIVEEGRVDFLAHDFLQPTPLRPDPDNPPFVFMIKSTLHNWTDDACVKIIENLSPAATSGTLLLVVNFTPSAPSESSSSISVPHYLDAIKGKNMREIQEMSLPTPAQVGVGWGYGNMFTSTMDGKMLILCNSRDRTIDDFKELLSATTWSLKEHTITRGLSSIIRVEKA